MFLWSVHYIHKSLFLYHLWAAAIDEIKETTLPKLLSCSPLADSVSYRATAQDISMSLTEIMIYKKSRYEASPHAHICTENHSAAKLSMVQWIQAIRSPPLLIPMSCWLTVVMICALFALLLLIYFIIYCSVN